MNPNVCVIALIYLSLDKVSSCGIFVDRPESPKPGNPVDSEIQFLTCAQRYQDGNQQKAIAQHIIPKLSKYKITHFIIKVENFDNNTEIYCTVNGNKDLVKENFTVTAKIGANTSVLDVSTKSIFYNKTILNVTNETPISNEEPAIHKYNETQNVLFSCPEHISKTNYTQLGIINPSSNMIETVLNKTLNQTFEITHDGTILCCIYYVVNGTEERWITRYVSNKTLLVYDDGTHNDGDDKRQQDTLNDTDDPDPGNQTKINVIASTAVATVVSVLVVIVVWKKRCRKKPKSNAKVLYADLDLLRQTAPETFQRPRPGPEEESPYAQIIGEMRPT